MNVQNDNIFNNILTSIYMIIQSYHLKTGERRIFSVLNVSTKNSKNMVVQAVQVPLEPGTVASYPVTVNVCGIH